MQKLFFLPLICLCLLLSSCITIEENYAPVSDISIIEPIPKKGIHKVLTGETLYSIAWRYGLNYSDIAKRNRISPPYALTVGQIIYLTGNQPIKKIPTHAQQKKSPKLAPPMIPKMVKAPTIIEREPTNIIRYWKWPASGSIIGRFSSSNKGVNIAGHEGDPVIATASGKVVYSGNGLRGYGNLIIIKHNSVFLTAYAHNETILVKDGDWINAGQEIAKMGNSGAQRVMLHFEIRRNGKPVNPLMYLGKRM